MNGYTILRVELEESSESAFAEYSSFYIADESDKYRIQVSGYSGSAGNTVSCAIFTTVYFSSQFACIDIWRKNHFKKTPTIMSNKFGHRYMAEILAIWRKTLSINRSIQANLSNYQICSMLSFENSNIANLSYFTETHSLVVRYSLRETLAEFTTQRSQLLSRQKHGQYKQIDRRKRLFKGD